MRGHSVLLVVAVALTLGSCTHFVVGAAVRGTRVPWTVSPHRARVVTADAAVATAGGGAAGAHIASSPETAGTGWSVVPDGRGRPQDPIVEYPPHTAADEREWPIGQAGFWFYNDVRSAYSRRGQPWGLWRQTRGAHLSEEEAVRTFLALGDPDKTGLAAARHIARAELNARGNTMVRPDVPQGSPHNRTTRGTALFANPNKLLHDRDQLQHLIDTGRLPAAFQAAADNLTSTLALAASREPEQFFLLAPAAVESLGRTFQRYTYAPPDPAPRLLEENLRFPLNLEKDWSAIEQEYFAQDPGIVVVDDFLTQEALENIRNLCLESTTFWDVRSTYVGSYANDGLGNHVLFRVIEELRRAMPNLIGDTPLQTMWSYKYFDNQVGIKKHCDDADLNINFWVTPDDANLDPDTGGLVVYRAQPPSNWTFDDFNLEPQSQINLERLLAESDAGYVRVPHRANRIVIFNSTLVHETDTFTFKTGYKNRRINFTFLFGQRKWVGRPE